MVFAISDFLCQQYGIKSGYLDATTSIQVASFFATHDSPNYLPCHEGVGVIYRFDVTESLKNKKDRAVLIGRKIFEKIEDKDINPEDIEFMLEDFHVNVLAREKPRQDFMDILKMPVNSYENSRMGREESVMLCAKIGKNEGNINEMVVDGVEDISSRKGFRAFYFKHDKSESEKISPRKDDDNVPDLYKKLLVYQIEHHRKIIKKRDNGEWLYLPKRMDFISDLMDPK